jgi:putative transposase
MTTPRRQIFDHSTPFWIKGSRLYFITMCTAPRHANQLCHPNVAKKILNAAAHYHANGRWHVELFLLMPDHLHALVGIPVTESMNTVIRSWKHYLSSKLGISWQRDYFDHRLRNHEGHEEKTAYIRHNPVRAGLVKRPGDWPYVWQPER